MMDGVLLVSREKDNSESLMMIVIDRAMIVSGGWIMTEL